MNFILLEYSTIKLQMSKIIAEKSKVTKNDNNECFISN